MFMERLWIFEVPGQEEVSLKRFFGITLAVAVVHAVLAIGLTTVATNAAEREGFAVQGQGHAFFRACGHAARMLFYPLILMRSNVYEPRTTILFIANSLLWGLAAAAAWFTWLKWRNAPRTL
jgi:hypothetical protein